MALDFVLDVEGLDGPDLFADFVDEVEDGGGLFGCSVGRDLDLDGGGRPASFGAARHGLALLRCLALWFDRSWASLSR